MGALIEDIQDIPDIPDIPDIQDIQDIPDIKDFQDFQDFQDIEQFHIAIHKGYRSRSALLRYIRRLTQYLYQFCIGDIGISSTLIEH